MDTLEINKRYSGLAESTCCLSCGGAIHYSNAKPGEVCVDLGSGRGIDVLRLAEEVGEGGFVYGIDVSDGMIEKANRNKEKLGINNVDFIQSELENIKLPAKTADLIISNCTLNHASDKQKVWNEIYRILKPGGRFSISDIFSVQPVSDEYRNDPVAISECWGGAVTKREYLQQIEEAGLSIISIVEESSPYAKGKIEVASFTILGQKPKVKCCCGGSC
jgi:ubiquinone/menaquinone biosynthesis C-methylase UbiE